MNAFTNTDIGETQRGAALLIAIFALLLISV